jgi:hypothetical protein
LGFNFNTLSEKADLLRYWLTDNDYISFQPTYNRYVSKMENSYFSSFKVEYARKLNETSNLGVLLKYSDVYSRISENDTWNSYMTGNSIEWLISYNWKADSFNFLTEPFNPKYAAAIGYIGNPQDYTQEYFTSFYSKYHHFDPNYNLLDDLETCGEHKGIGINLSELIQGNDNNPQIILNLSAMYDYSASAMLNDLYVENGNTRVAYDNYNYSGQDVHTFLELKFRYLMFDCIMISGTKSIFFDFSGTIIRET